MSIVIVLSILIAFNFGMINGMSDTTDQTESGRVEVEPVEQINSSLH